MSRELHQQMEPHEVCYIRTMCHLKEAFTTKHASRQHDSTNTNNKDKCVLFM